MDAGTITAICALIVSVVATGLAIWFGVIQRNHMRLSVRPIAAVPIADFEDRVGVFLANKGLGPMLIKKLEVKDKNGNIHSDLLSHMPPLKKGVLWLNFHVSVDGAALEQGRRLELLVLEGDPKNTIYRESRDDIRKVLKDLTVKVEYEDLYGNTLPSVEKELSFFGRHGSK